ncbi:unnamed protein product [Arctogadus glacialis]
MLYLGYEKPPEKKRRRVVRSVDSQVATTEQAVMVFEQPQTFKDAQTQWMDPAEEDHTYSKGSILICDMIITPAPEISLSIAEVTLKVINNASSR